MTKFQKAYKFAKKSIWKDDTLDEVILNLSKTVFKNMKKNCTKTKKFFWLTGQSGSGKTSQLYEATEHFCQNHNIKPIHFAVRNFAIYHPKAKAFEKNTNFREITNGFALKLLICVLNLAIIEGYDIILEICFLDNVFQKFVLDSLQKQNYKLSLQIMAVNKTLSKYFEYKRSLRIPRKTNLSSFNYFYKHMGSGLNYICRHYDLNCCIWSAYNKSPIFIGKIKFAKKTFKNQRKILKNLFFDEKTLLKSKIIILGELYQDDFF